MRFDWDERKNRANRDKHGITFEAASRVFDDPLIVSEHDGFENGEERFRVLGMIDGVVILFVVFTFRSNETDEEVTRIISARRATPQERLVYEKETRPFR